MCNVLRVAVISAVRLEWKIFITPATYGTDLHQEYIFVDILRADIFLIITSLNNMVLPHAFLFQASLDKA